MLAPAVTEFERALRELYGYFDRAAFEVEPYFERLHALAQGSQDLRRLLHRATFAFTDPHLLVQPLADDDPNVWPTCGDLALEKQGERFVVADVRAGTAADQAGVRPGWAIVGAELDSVWAGTVTEPTEVQSSYAATLWANGLRTGTRELTFLTEVGHKRLLLANPREHARIQRPPLEVSVQSGAVLVRWNNSLGNLETIAAFDRVIEEHLDADALILDLRDTPSGGNTDIARAILGHFLSEERPYQVHTVPAILRRTTVPRKFIELALPRAPRFRGRLAVLCGRWTGSMGEGLVIGLHGAASATTFGSRMGRLLGALHRVPLPLTESVLELGVEVLSHVDGTPREDYVADFPMDAADRDTDGGDPALEAARRWL